ncbi:MAG TPA: endonuclease/exonuclease/phosphatase family protein [Acidimicrobiia bacterium]|jgi:endonuclease/exonuclease/phosphatase family metal-dependent hydrolase
MDTYDAGYGALVDTTVRLATWNIWARYGPWQKRAPVILETLRALEPDIIGLQEVWDDGDHNQAREIASALGYAHVEFEANLEHRGAWFPQDPPDAPDAVTRAGNAVISRWPIRRREVRLLSRDSGDARDDEGEERVCLLAEVDGPRGPIQMYCAHLSWRGDHSAVRQRQVGDICAFVREQRPRTFPSVLVGDLNSDPDSDEIRMLTGRATTPVPGVLWRDVWEWTGKVARGEPGHTWSNDNAFAAASLDVPRRIDFIMVAAPKAGGCGHPLDVHVIGDRPIDGVWGSDHYGLVADLRY